MKKRHFRFVFLCILVAMIFSMMSFIAAADSEMHNHEQEVEIQEIDGQKVTGTRAANNCPWCKKQTIVCVSLNETQHRVCCIECGVIEVEQHTLTGPLCQATSCPDCGYTRTGVGHRYTTWTYKNANNHVANCTYCNVTATRNHIRASKWRVTSQMYSGTHTGRIVCIVNIFGEGCGAALVTEVVQCPTPNNCSDAKQCFLRNKKTPTPNEVE